MKKISLLLCLLMVISMFSACKPNDENGSKSGIPSKNQGQSDKEGGDKDGSDSTENVDNGEEMEIIMYNVAANYNGEQPGWFGKVLKDELNITLNILAPQVVGQEIYQTRAADGYLGDIILLDNKDLVECIKNGLVEDITDDVKNSQYLSAYTEQYDMYNSMFDGNDSDTRYYGLPCGVTSNSPKESSEETIGVAPYLPWDYYSELGFPEMENTDDLLDVLEAMYKNHPTTADGLPTFPITMWKDWDGNYAENPKVLSEMYGYEMYKGTYLLGNDNSIVSITDDDNIYRKMIKFFFDANQRGLVDPDSPTQDWDTAQTKMSNKQILFYWYQWQRGFYNTEAKEDQLDAYMPFPLGDSNTLVWSDGRYGNGRAYAVGANLDPAKKERVMKVLDFLASPKGNEYQHIGIPGWSYTDNGDGTYTQTEEGKAQLVENLEVPAEFGGGGFSDGNQKLNDWLIGGTCINPENGLKYYDYFKANKKVTEVWKQWQEKYNAEHGIEYLKNRGDMVIVPSINMIEDVDTTDIALIRGQCGELIKDTSWRMAFAKNEAEFNSLWDDMKEQLNGLGWEQLQAFDKPLAEARIQMREKALK